MLVPPENFSMVENGIYRSSKLDAINISFLKSINLKSIVWINEEKPSRALRHFIGENQVKLFHMTNSGTLLEEDEIVNVKYQEWMVLKPGLISKAIETIMDVFNQNCLVMDTSEVIIGILRHIQRWNYSSILSEYRLYARKTSYKAEIFLELIKLELISNDEDLNEDENSLLLDKRRTVSGSDFEETDPFIVIEGDSSNNNHSLTEAIQIRQGSNEPTSSGLQATSPTIRRLSVEPINSPSSSVGHLSISTSPQIPKNLLKMAELRKNRKKHSNLEQQNQQQQKPLLDQHPLHAPSKLTTNLSASALNSYAWAPVSKTKNFSYSHETPTNDQFQWALYQPRINGAVVARPGSTHNARPMNTTIRVRLPPTAGLPLWFLELRSQCETQCSADISVNRSA
jgi:hypothetical protein